WMVVVLVLILLGSGFTSIGYDQQTEETSVPSTEYWTTGSTVVSTAATSTLTMAPYEPLENLYRWQLPGNSCYTFYYPEPQNLETRFPPYEIGGYYIGLNATGGPVDFWIARYPQFEDFYGNSSNYCNPRPPNTLMVPASNYTFDGQSYILHSRYDPSMS